MKMQTLFDLLESAQDFLSHFDKVSSPEQLVSRLAVLRRQDPEDMLYDVLALKAAVTNVLSENLELGGNLTADSDTPETSMEELLGTFTDDQEEDTQETPPGDQPAVPNDGPKENPTA